MDPSKREFVRSIVAPALLANNQYGLTPIELEMEIKELYGKPLEMPYGIRNLEELIFREFKDEFYLTSRSDGVKVFKLIPKADTADQFAMIMKQNKSKQMSKKLAHSRLKNLRSGGNRPFSSMSSHMDFRLDHKELSRHNSSSGRTTSQKAFASSSTKMANTNKSAIQPVMPSSSLLNSLNSMFGRVQTLNIRHGNLDLGFKVRGVEIAQVSFPTSLAETLTVFERFATDGEKYFPKTSLSGGRDSGLGGSSPFPLEFVEHISIISASRFPKVGSILKKVVLVDIFTLRRFLVQVTTPQGKTKLLPCSLHNIELKDEKRAIEKVLAELESFKNVFEIIVKAHSNGLCEVDIVTSQSITKHLLEDGSVVSKTSVVNASSRLTETDKTFTAIVTAISTVSTFFVVLKRDKIAWDDLNVIASKAGTMAHKISNLAEVHVGTIYLARQDDAGWSRVVVESKLDPSDVIVRFLDYGNRESLDARDLFVIPDHFQQALLKFPSLAFAVKVLDFAAYNDVENALELMRYQCVDAMITFEAINLSKRLEDGKVPMVRIDAKFAADVRGLIADKFLRFKMEKGSEFMVNISQTKVSDDGRKLQLHCQHIGGDLDKVMENVELIIAERVAAKREQPNFALLKEGDELAGPYEDMYYRCFLLKILDGDRARVLFYDYGNEEEVALEDFNNLPDYLTSKVIPPQAFCCQLSGFENKKWITGASKVLQDEGIFDCEFNLIIDQVHGSDVFATLWPENRSSLAKPISLNDQLKEKRQLFRSEDLFSFRDVAKALPEIRSHSVAGYYVAISEGEESDGDSDVFESPVLANFASKLPRFTLPVAAPFEAICSGFLAPESFVCHSTSSGYEKLKNELAKFTTTMSLSSLDSFEPGKIALAFHNGSFCRAQIITEASHSCRVSLVDEGEQQIVGKTLLFKLPENFALQPPFGFVFKLGGVPEHLSSYFQKQLTNFGSDLCEKSTRIRISANKCLIDGAIVKLVGQAIVTIFNNQTDFDLHDYYLHELVRPLKAP